MHIRQVGFLSGFRKLPLKQCRFLTAVDISPKVYYSLFHCKTTFFFTMNFFVDMLIHNLMLWQLNTWKNC